jgi:V/A-type H+-transporting ATPase subunit E
LDDIRALEQAIMQDAREEVDQILDDAQARAESIRTQAEAEAGAERDTILQRARRDAEALQEQAIAAAQIEAQTLKLKRREQLLARVFTHVREQLAGAPQWPDYEQIARHLVREALEHLDTDHAVVRADAETSKTLTKDVLAGLASDLGVYLQPGEPLTSGTGIVLETPDGHRRYDNTLETRLARMQDMLRTPVYHILMGETP